MEKIPEPTPEEKYNFALEGLRESLAEYALCVYEERLVAEKDDSDHVKLKSRRLEKVEKSYRKAIAAAEEMSLPNGPGQIFYNFRNYFKELGLSIKEFPAVKTDMEKILKNVGAKNGMDFSNPAVQTRDGNVTWVDFKRKR